MNPLRAFGAFLDWAWPVETRPILSVLAAQQLADDEAEREAWEMNELFSMPALNGYLHFQTSPVNGAGTAAPVVGESPAAAASATSAAAGHPWHPHRRPKSLHAAAVFGLRQWLNGEPCEAPTYFGCIAHDLEQLAK